MLERILSNVPSIAVRFGDKATQEFKQIQMKQNKKGLVKKKTDRNAVLKAVGGVVIKWKYDKKFKQWWNSEYDFTIEHGLFKGTYTLKEGHFRNIATLKKLASAKKIADLLIYG